MSQHTQALCTLSFKNELQIQVPSCAGCTGPCWSHYVPSHISETGLSHPQAVHLNNTFLCGYRLFFFFFFFFWSVSLRTNPHLSLFLFLVTSRLENGIQVIGMCYFPDTDFCLLIHHKAVLTLLCRLHHFTEWPGAFKTEQVSQLSLWECQVPIFVRDLL